MSKAGKYDMLDYWIYRGGKEEDFASLPLDLQNILLDLGSTVQDLVHEFQCEDHPGSMNIITIRLGDEGTSVKLWACCLFRRMLLEFMLLAYNIPGDVSGPDPTVPVNLEQLSARVKANVAARFLKDG